MGYQKSKQKTPMLGILLGSSCTPQDNSVILSNPKGSNYDLSTPDQSLLDQGIDQSLLDQGTDQSLLDQGMIEDANLVNADQSMGSQKSKQKMTPKN
jgi:hypothetical protein